jgi:hypothetical protein
MRCDYCKKEFINKRRTARFCSSKCRVYFSRKFTEQAIATKRVVVLKPMPPIMEAVKEARREADLPMPVCKNHGTPLTLWGKCLQKGCKYA